LKVPTNTTFLAFWLAGGVHECQLVRRAAALEALFKCDGDLFGKADTDEAGSGDRVAVADQGDGFGGGDDLALVGLAGRAGAQCIHAGL
jgi:hypothetical protein